MDSTQDDCCVHPPLARRRKPAPAIDAQHCWFRPRTSRPRINATQEGGALDYDLKSSLPITERAPAQSSAPPFGQRSVAITANPCTAQEEERWWWVSLLRTAWGTWGTHALALADQAVVSAASFLTTVVIA